MSAKRAYARGLVGLAALGLAFELLALPARAQDSERLRNAKALLFDHKYSEARQIWIEAAAGKGTEAEAAAYWVARCSESLKEDERALKEYGDYLARRPSDRLLAEEARTSRVALATRLYRSGKTQYLALATDALGDSSKTVRYYAALQLASLGPKAGQPAVPLLKQIVAQEKDPDLVDRAKLALLRVDPQALAAPVVAQAGPATRTGPTAAGPATAPAREVSMVRVRIYKAGKATPDVSINLPVALADLVIKSLPDDARHELKLKGFDDAGALWEKLKKLGPTEILTVEGDEGERIQIWIE